MKVPALLLSMIFSMIFMFSFVSSFFMTKQNTTVQVETVKLVVKEMKTPRNFEVVFVDANGQEYFYEKQWCENYKKFNKGTVHEVEVKTVTVKFKKSNRNETNITTTFKVNCD